MILHVWGNEKVNKTQLATPNMLAVKFRAVLTQFTRQVFCGANVQAKFDLGLRRCISTHHVVGMLYNR